MQQAVAGLGERPRHLAPEGLVQGAGGVEEGAHEGPLRGGGGPVAALAGDPRCESGEPSAVSHVERGAARQVPPLNMDRAERLEMGKWRVTNRENKWESVGECDIWEKNNGRV